MPPCKYVSVALQVYSNPPLLDSSLIFRQIWGQLWRVITVWSKEGSRCTLLYVSLLALWYELPFYSSIFSDGSDINPLDEEALVAECHKIKAKGLSNIVLIGVHSPLDVEGKHEYRAREIVRKELGPDVNIVCSRDGEFRILPTFRKARVYIVITFLQSPKSVSWKERMPR